MAKAAAKLVSFQEFTPKGWMSGDILVKKERKPLKNQQMEKFS
ncbi:MAG: hypothetical protein U0X91_00150 [Spirosomataceae bacterium]